MLLTAQKFLITPSVAHRCAILTFLSTRQDRLLSRPPATRTESQLGCCSSHHRGAAHRTCAASGRHHTAAREADLRWEHGAWPFPTGGMTVPPMLRLGHTCMFPIESSRSKESICLVQLGSVVKAGPCHTINKHISHGGIFRNMDHAQGQINRSAFRYLDNDCRQSDSAFTMLKRLMWQLAGGPSASVWRGSARMLIVRFRLWSARSLKRPHDSAGTQAGSNSAPCG